MSNEASKETVGAYETDSEFVDIDMGDCRIEFYNYKGDRAKTGDLVRNHMWQLISDKIDPTMVRSVTIPTLRYDTNEELTITVEIAPTL